jgi:hypothetical protein
MPRAAASPWRGLVQLGVQHLLRAAGQALPGDEHLRQAPAVGVLPPVPGEVAQQQRARRGPAGPRAEREDDLGHLGCRARIAAQVRSRAATIWGVTDSAAVMMTTSPQF